MAAEDKSDRADSEFERSAADDDVTLAGKRITREWLTDQIKSQRTILEKDVKAKRDVWAHFPPIFTLAFTALSFFGTYIGLSDIIATGDARAGLIGDVMVAALVLLATLAMVYFLRRAVVNLWSLAGAASAFAYAFLVFFSVTFGFAFYWGRLEAANQAISGASTRLEEFVDEIEVSAGALKAAVGDLTRLEAEFRRLADVERTSGGTCGDGSPPGPGPRMRHRERRAEEIKARVTQLTPRFASAEAPLTALTEKMAEIEKLGELPGDVDKVAERQRVLREARLRARAAAVAINTLTQDSLIRSAADQFRIWGEEYRNQGFVRRDDPQGSRYRCYSVAAGDQLISTADGLSNLPKVSAPDLPSYAGAAATREAVFRMLESASGFLTGGPSGWFGGGGGIGDLFSGAPVSEPNEAAIRNAVEEAVGRRDADGRVEIVTASISPGLRPQDRFPLAVAIVVDLLLFLFVLIERPGREYFDRFKKSVRDAMEEKFDPMQMMALRAALEYNPVWVRLQRYRFDYKDQTYVVQPTDPRGDVTFLILRDVLKLWLRNGVVKRPLYRSRKIREILTEIGATDTLSAFHQDQTLEAFEFTEEGFERLLLMNLVGGKAETDYGVDIVDVVEKSQGRRRAEERRAAEARAAEEAATAEAERAAAEATKAAADARRAAAEAEAAERAAIFGTGRPDEPDATSSGADGPDDDGPDRGGPDRGGPSGLGRGGPARPDGDRPRGAPADSASASAPKPETETAKAAAAAEPAPRPAPVATAAPRLTPTSEKAAASPPPPAKPTPPSPAPARAAPTPLASPPPAPKPAAPKPAAPTPAATPRPPTAPARPSAPAPLREDAKRAAPARAEPPVSRAPTVAPSAPEGAEPPRSIDARDLARRTPRSSLADKARAVEAEIAARSAGAEGVERKPPRVAWPGETTPQAPRPAEPRPPMTTLELGSRDLAQDGSKDADERRRQETRARMAQGLRKIRGEDEKS